MSSSTFRLQVRVPKKVTVPSLRDSEIKETLGREEFYAWSWDSLASEGILGVHEGTLLSADAAEQGFETDAWTLDAGEAPRERDWISSQEWATAEFYFPSLDAVRKAVEKLETVEGIIVGRIEEQIAEDWDAQWKASFLSSPMGVEISPIWRILPPWVTDAPISKEVILRINPGAGFGTGTHETTQLCLGAIAEYSLRSSLQGQKVLDFGSGSGVLGIGAALLGAQIDAVEIDPLAIDNAVENAALNQVSERISFSRSLENTHGPYRMVIANILRPVLLEFAESLVSRLDSRGVVILSGLIEKDEEEVTRRYSELLGFTPQRKVLGEWRALVWVR